MFPDNSTKSFSGFFSQFKNLINKSDKLFALNLAILLLPVNLTISGIIFIYIILRTLLINPKNNSIQPLHNNFLSDKYLDISLRFSLLSFVVWSLIQGLFAFDKLAHYAGLIGHYLVYLLLFNILLKLISSTEKVKNLFGSIVISGLVASIIAILSFFKLIKSFKLFYIPIYGSGDYLLNFDLGDFGGRASSFAMNPNILGCYLLITIFISMFLLNSLNTGNFSSFSKFLYYEKNIGVFKLKILEILILLQGFSLILTGSRGSIISLCFGIFLLFIFQKKQRLKIIILFALLGITAFYPLGKTTRLNSAIDFNYSSNQKRIEVWQDSIEIIKDFPYGVGILNYEKIYPYYLKPGKLYIPHSHNWILHTCIESGILGTIIFFTFYFSLVGFFIRNLSKKALQIPIILICFFIFNLTDYVLTDTRICILMVLVISTAYVLIINLKSRTLNF